MTKVKSLLGADAGELLLEPRHAAAAVEQVLLAAGPGRVRLRVDVEVQRVASLAPGGAGGEFAAVGHLHRDGVVVGMDIGLHVIGLWDLSLILLRFLARFVQKSRVYTAAGRKRQVSGLSFVVSPMAFHLKIP